MPATKEEFGLAIVEALAAGLPVTAPLAGGPATYVEPGRTGTLVDTTDTAALASAIGATPRPGPRRRTPPGTPVPVVEERYTLERMARSLTAVYRVSAGASTLGVPVADSTERTRMRLLVITPGLPLARPADADHRRRLAASRATAWWWPPGRPWRRSCARLAWSTWS